MCCKGERKCETVWTSFTVKYFKLETVVFKLEKHIYINCEINAVNHLTLLLTINIDRAILQTVLEASDPMNLKTQGSLWSAGAIFGVL